MAKQCPEHVDVAELQTLIEKQPDAEKDYLTKRWLHQLRWWECRAWDARWKYFLCRSIVVVGGVLIPVLGTLPNEWRIDWQSIVAFAVAASAAVEALYNWGGIWLEKRKATELLKCEGFLFLLRAGIYRAAPDPLAAFVENVENKIAHEVGEYASIARPRSTTNSGSADRDERR